MGAAAEPGGGRPLSPAAAAYRRMLERDAARDGGKNAAEILPELLRWGVDGYALAVAGPALRECAAILGLAVVPEPRWYRHRAPTDGDGDPQLADIARETDCTRTGGFVWSDEPQWVWMRGSDYPFGGGMAGDPDSIDSLLTLCAHECRHLKGFQDGGRADEATCDAFAAEVLPRLRQAVGAWPATPARAVPD